MLKDLIKKAAKTGIGLARFAAMEFKERVTYNAPSAIQPSNTEPGELGADSSLPMVPELSAAKLHRELSSDTPPIILDCREEHEWVAGYIDGSVHISMNELPERVKELDPNRRTIVLCLHGMRSAEVASWLKHTKSFSDVRSLEGGIVSWYADYDQERVIVLRDEEH